MTIQRVKGSAWDSSDHLIFDNVAALAALPEEQWEGTVFIQGHTNPLDGGAGWFYWSPNATRSLADGNILIDPTGTGVGTGCWFRQFDSRAVSLTIFGENRDTTAALQEAYGFENAITHIGTGTGAGWFKWNAASVPNHDGVNNFNGWVRINDPIFSADLDMQGNKLRNVGTAVAGTDVPNLDQVQTMVNTGDYVGVTPLYSPRYTGDNATVQFATAASTASPEPDPLLVTGPEFEVTVDGLKLRHVEDFTVNNTPGDPNFGILTFNVPPALNADIDIVWYAPIMVNNSNSDAVTATTSGTTNTLEDWFGNNGQDILVQPTGVTGRRTLGDITADSIILFDTTAAMVAGYANFKAGSVVGTRGRTTAGDGPLSFYYIKTQAQAVTDGDDFTSPGTNNVLISAPSLVAVYQVPETATTSMEQKTLTAGQTVVNMVNDVTGATAYLSGIDADNGFLEEGTDYTLSGSGKTVTLAESQPAGTILTFLWNNPVDLAASTTDNVFMEVNSNTIIDDTINSGVIIVDTSGGNVQIELPVLGAQREFIIKKATNDVNTVTVIPDSAGAETIDGAANAVLPGGALNSVTVYGTDNFGWMIV